MLTTRRQGQNNNNSNANNMKKRESVEIFDQMTQLHERIHGRNQFDSRLPQTANGDANNNYHQDPMHRGLPNEMDQLLPNQLEVFVQSFMGKTIRFITGFPKIGRAHV